jgi:carbamate kinase
MGHYLALALSSEIVRRGIDVPVVCVVTHVIVAPGAPEFEHPDKPVGPAYAEAEARRLAAERGWDVRRAAGGGWRRVVASPRPVRALEEEVVRLLLDAGICVIAGGGGGVPVAEGLDGLRGVDAVIDKDYTAERLAASLGASRLVVLTDVPGAALAFATPGRRYLREMSVAEARVHLERGEFAPGSMAPKVEACVEFVEAGGGEAVIAATSDAAAAFEGRAGTRITGH